MVTEDQMMAGSACISHYKYIFTFTNIINNWSCHFWFPGSWWYSWGLCMIGITLLCSSVCSVYIGTKFIHVIPFLFVHQSRSEVSGFRILNSNNSFWFSIQSNIQKYEILPGTDPWECQNINTSSASSSQIFSIHTDKVCAVQLEIMYKFGDISKWVTWWQRTWHRDIMPGPCPARVRSLWR